MKNGFYIRLDGEKVILEPKDTISLTHMDLVELVIPYGAKYIHCRNNNLTKLILPDTVVCVYCDSNKLTELIVPSGVLYIHCSNNNLTKLIIPDSAKECFFNNNNKLTELIIPDDCMVICDPHVLVITRTMINRSNRLKAILK